MSEYHKIETLYERDVNTFKVKPGVLKNRTYSAIKSWVWTEKVDGTNIRCVWDVQPLMKQLTFGGKTNNAQLPSGLHTWMFQNILPANLEAIFPEQSVVIYGEGYGAGIRKGGGNYRKDKGLIVFDVFIIDKNNIFGGWWLNYDAVLDIATKLGLPTVPLIGDLTLEDATAIVKAGFTSRCATTPDTKAEGLVGRPIETLYDKKGHRIITKLKTKDFE